MAHATQKTFKIISEKRSSEGYQEIKFYAVDANGKKIFGSEVEIYRDQRMFGDREWREWRIVYGSGGDPSYEAQLPRVASINAAMKKIKSQIKKD